MSESSSKVLDRFGFIGDVHAEDVLLCRAISYLGRRVPSILCAGDIADTGYGSFDRCCSLLRENDVATVSGNHDRWLRIGMLRQLPRASSLQELSQENSDWHASLPRTIEYRTEIGALLLCHGLGTDDMALVKPDDFGYALESNVRLSELVKEKRYAVMVNGHSHAAMVRTFGNLTIINAGRLRRGHEGFFLIVDIPAKQVTWYSFSGTTEVEVDKVIDW